MSSLAWLPPLNSLTNGFTCVSVEQHKLPSSEEDPLINVCVAFYPVMSSHPNRAPFLGLDWKAELAYSYVLLPSSPSRIRELISSVLSYLRVRPVLDRLIVERGHFDQVEFTSSLESEDSFAVRIQEFLASMRNKTYNAGHKNLPFHIEIMKVMIRISDDEYNAWTTWYDEKKKVDPYFVQKYKRAISRPRTDEELLSEEALKFKAATQSAIKNLKIFRIDDSNSTVDCLVCLEELKLGSEAICLPCSHVFHGNCILKCLQKSNMCPLCRHKFS